MMPGVASLGVSKCIAILRSVNSGHHGRVTLGFLVLKMLVPINPSRMCISEIL